jgi:hypothetical protein
LEEFIVVLEDFVIKGKNPFFDEIEKNGGWGELRNHNLLLMRKEEV